MSELSELFALFCVSAQISSQLYTYILISPMIGMSWFYTGLRVSHLLYIRSCPRRGLLFGQKHATIF